MRGTLFPRIIILGWHMSRSRDHMILHKLIKRTYSNSFSLETLQVFFANMWQDRSGPDTIVPLGPFYKYRFLLSLNRFLSLSVLFHLSFNAQFQTNNSLFYLHVP